MNPIDDLCKLYQEASFKDESDDKKLIFVKSYKFKEQDDTEKEVEFEVRYNREYLYMPPEVIDRKFILTSMHSSYNQCWARHSEISHQAGLGIVAPSLIENQIKKLIDAHIKREYHTINESPEFTYAFESRKLIDHSNFYVDCSVLEKVIEIGQGKIIRGLVEYSKEMNQYQAVALPDGVQPGLMVFDDKPQGKNLKAYYLNVNAVPHFDWRIPLPDFLYNIERLSGILPKDDFLQNIKEEIFVVVVFLNKKLGHHDIVVFRKRDKELILLPHARVSSRPVLFSRHKEEYFKLQDKKIALFGLGAIGSMIGLTLLQSGIDQIIVADPDFVDLENTTRSIYCQSDIGMPKTEAFKKRALIKDADFDSRVLSCEKIEDIEKYNPDFVIVCIGEVYKEYQLSHIFRKKHMDKLVFVFGQNDCTWAGVYFQDSPQVGCQECLFLSQKENKELQIPYVASFAEGVGCGNPSYISSPSDIGLIANIAAKLIIERITGNRKNSPNYYVWCSNPDPSAWRDEQLEQFSLKKYRVKKHAECSCQHLS